MSAYDELAAQVAEHGPFPMPTGDTGRPLRRFTPLEEAVQGIETAIAPLTGDAKAGADMVLAYLRTLTTPDTTVPRDLRPGAETARRMIADRQTPEDPHDSPLHHSYAVGRDLPEVKPSCTAPHSPSCSCASGEYRFCGASLGRDEYPFTCNRRVAHQGPCSGDLDSEVSS